MAEAVLLAAKVLGYDGPEFFGDESFCRLLESPELDAIIAFMFSSNNICRGLIGYAPDEILRNEGLRVVFGQSARKIFTRAVAIIRGMSRNENKPQSQLTMDFVSLINSNLAKRIVRAHLGRLELSEPKIDFGDFGTITACHWPDYPPEALASLFEIHSGPRCHMEFVVETQKFGGVTLFPLADVLRQRVTLLRLALHPLVSYNRFTVSHIWPWELGLSDDSFAVRFSVGSRNSGPQASYQKVAQSDANNLRRVIDSSAGIHWDRFTPWRLAADRLDDAVFKLACGSPDVILDLVIAIESIFVEQGNRQESTHKVATRVARFLGTNSS
jgi:hypothetical protein